MHVRPLIETERNGALQSEILAALPGFPDQISPRQLFSELRGGPLNATTGEAQVALLGLVEEGGVNLTSHYFIQAVKP